MLEFGSVLTVVEDFVGWNFRYPLWRKLLTMIDRFLSVERRATSRGAEVVVRRFSNIDAALANIRE